MGDKCSNDAVLVQLEKMKKHSDGPLIELLKSLITNDGKKTTVLTNSQILNILQIEFDMDLKKLHDLEVDIYLNVVKKYLKDWPEWNVFDKAVTDLKEKGDDVIKDIIKTHYVNLKMYLRCILGIAQELAPNVIKKIPQKQNQSQSTDTIDEENLVMEVEATRSQLNNFILRYPVNDNIFNLESASTLNNNSNWLSLGSILNWTGIKFEIKFKWSNNQCLVLKYDNNHKVKMNLVNKKLLMPPPDSKLDIEWQVKLEQSNLMKISKSSLLHRFKQYNSTGKCIKWRPLIRSAYKTLKHITQNMPSNIEIPAYFRRNLSEHSFVRYMYQNVPEDSSALYDLQLEEIISPQCQLNISLLPDVGIEETVTIICEFCQMTYTGQNIVKQIENHFKISHSNELDWKCMFCSKTIPVSTLTEKSWQHTCDCTESLSQSVPS
ncbi:uncharacterized protein [Battus philenor]|uniref:uncharacterized protein n=1 Tax=Battus philenor TaxID=42288 RepID=UPI0035CF5A89